MKNDVMCCGRRQVGFPIWPATCFNYWQACPTPYSRAVASLLGTDCPNTCNVIHTQRRNELYRLLTRLSRRTFLCTVTTVTSGRFSAISISTANRYATPN